MNSSLPALISAAVISVALGCASGVGPSVAAQTETAVPPAALEKPRAGSHGFRLGLWELDLLALDLEPRGTTFRMLDFKILKGLEIGGGDDYHSFSLIEMPNLLNVVTTRREGPTYEHRVADLQALALALLRLGKKSANESETHLLKVPVAGSLYGHDVDGPAEKRRLLYLFGWESER
jgi:hypothetical protein